MHCKLANQIRDISCANDNIHLLDKARLNIKIYSVELKISDEAEGRVGYILARLNKS